MCGEKLTQILVFVCFKGSPPRVRGKAPFPPAAPWGPWITPACAGKRSQLQCKRPDTRDHPRVCGEKLVCYSLHVVFQGSPPRVRGKGDLQIGASSLSGITPACAGKSSARHWKRPATRDHPRVCGEKNMERIVALGIQGSPPRVRGKACLLSRFLVLPGITPACAGKRVTEKFDGARR